MTAQTQPPYLKDQEKLARWRKIVLAKGSEIARRLENFLASDEMNFDLSNVITLADLGKNTGKKERLKAYLRHINAIIQSFNQGHFGLCRVCEKPLSEAELNEMPWSDICQECHKSRDRA